ncbi:TRAP transporter small permease subunit [Gordonia sp. KTR9]|uniref:TRAP transporter small permease subunit n=1 Tax=Gordonia sp. KTR9 TaxID=337191 RepID=UPI003FCC8E28
MLNITADVVLRVLTGQPLDGTNALVSTIWMPLIVFLGLGFAQARNEHIRVTLVSDRLSPTLLRIATASSLLVAMVATAVLIYASFNEAVRSFEIDQTTTGIVALPVWPMKFVMLLGFILLFLQFLRSFASAGTPESQVTKR